MRVALISDLHGNQVALDAVLDDVARIGADRTVCLGDTAALGPDPAAVLDTLRRRNIPTIMGNHDEFLIRPELLTTYTEAPPIVAAHAWCHAHLTADHLAFVESFVDTLEVPLGPGTALFCFHGSPQSHMDDILADTEEERLDRWLGHLPQPVLACGHTHIQLVRQHHGALIVNPGSVGAPFKDYVKGGTPTIMPYAEYAVVSLDHGVISCELRRVPVEVDALIAAAEACDNPLASFWVEQYRANA